MKTTIKKLMPILLCVLFADCKQANNDNCNNSFELVETIDIPDEIETQPNNFIDKIEYIPLIGSDAHIMPEVTKVRFENNRFYLCSKKTQSINVFDNDGTFSFCISKRGKGNGEYLEIANFTVDENNIYIIDNFAHKIHLYDAFSGRFICDREIPFICSDMEYLCENRFLFTFLLTGPDDNISIEQKHGAVWETDSTFQNVTSEYLPYEDGYYEIIGQNTYFNKNEKGICFHSCQNNGFMMFEKDKKLPQFYQLNFTYPIPTGEGITYREAIEQGYTILSGTPHMTDKFVFLEIASNEIGETAVIKRASSKVYTNDQKDCSSLILQIIYSHDNYAISYLSDNFVYEDLVKNDFQKAPEDVETLLKNGGACLLKYTFNE